MNVICTTEDFMDSQKFLNPIKTTAIKNNTLTKKHKFYCRLKNKEIKSLSCRKQIDIFVIFVHTTCQLKFCFTFNRNYERFLFSILK